MKASWMRRAPSTWLAGAALLLGMVTGPVWGPGVLAHLAFFRVRRVRIVGTTYLTTGQVLGRLRIDTTASVWDPLAPLEARLASHPLILSASVRRELPGTLVVTITEAVPVAFVPTDSGLRSYDERGVLLPIDPVRDAVDVPVATRPDRDVLRLLGRLRVADQAIYAEISEIRTEGHDELCLELPSVVVRARRDVTVEQLADVDAVERDLRKRQLRATEVDLRYRDQVIARVQ